VNGQTRLCSNCGLEAISKPWAAAVVAWTGVIFFSSTSLAQQWADLAFRFFTGQAERPHVEHGLFYLLVDKGFHVTLFCIFALLLSQALRPPQGKLILLAGAIVGSCSEYLQSLFPGRDPALRDVAINIGGTALGLLLHRQFSLKLQSRSRTSTHI
jgi:VanZ family protein